MQIKDLDLDPDEIKLRSFGRIGCTLLALWALAPLRSGAPIHGVALGASLVVGLLSVVGPRVLRPLWVAMMLVGFPIGWTISFVLLAFVYFGMLTPMAIIGRVIGRDPMERGLDRALPTYWKKRVSIDDPARYLRQF